MSMKPHYPDELRAAYPPAPAGLVIYAIGDIHGRADLLDQIHGLIDEDAATCDTTRKVEIYLGDYIDRGPEPATVVSRLIQRAGRTNAVFLRGNHEQFLLDFLDGVDCWAGWRAVGCVTSCLSYGIKPDLLSFNAPAEAVRETLGQNLPQNHLQFYADTGSYCHIGPYLFVHAGIRPGIPLEAQVPADLLNIRGSFLDFEGDFGWIVIHGHTAVDTPDLRKHRINIDTGAFATNRLTCLRVDGNGVGFLTTNRGRSEPIKSPTRAPGSTDG
jgi:serine/threonine protein phosphatase 1